MSRLILKARCSTPDEFVDFLQSSTPVSTYDPKKLTVFVGDKANINGGLSIMPCSGGLYSAQHFDWINIDKITGLDRTKLFFDYSSASVTLSVDLEPQVSDSVAYGTASALIPQGALAVNLGNKGFQLNASNMLNGDEWGKLVYYEQGGLGLGWAFSANRYLPYRNNVVPQGLGMYMLGGLLPDVDSSDIVSQTGATYISSTPAANLQVGRDQAVLTQMVTSNIIPGPQGFWSVQPTNFDATNAACGRTGGMLVNGTGSSTITPVFNSYSPFGFLCLSYPTALQNETQTTASVGWNLMFPSYAPSTQDGYMPTGNALSVPPGSFFTDKGLQLLQNNDSNPSAPTVPNKLWTDYWKYATSVVHLEETKPFYIEAPLFNAPVAMNIIPFVGEGLDLLVPITRICNGVYFYTPIKTGTDSVQPLNMNAESITDTNYFSNPFGTLQKWFSIKKVSLTLNMPFVRLDTALQASRFFNTPYMDKNLGVTAPVWIKFYYTPPVSTPTQFVVDPVSADTTMSLVDIAAASVGGYMQFNYTARQLLLRFSSVLNTHGTPVSNGAWGLSNLQISRVAVSCTTLLDLPRLYSTLFRLPAFNSSPQGAILSRGGMKAFARCGPSLSEGPPNNMSLLFVDVLGDSVGNMASSGVREAYFDVSDVRSVSYGSATNDYFNSTSEFVFSNSIYLRMPDATTSSDSGGSIVLNFMPRPILNLPFSGEVLKSTVTGGPQFTSKDLQTGVLSTANIASYAQGWFNNLNPFSPDYNTQYNYNTGVAESTDSMPYLDYKLVNFTRRKIEIWFELQVPVQIYTGSPL